MIPLQWSLKLRRWCWELNWERCAWACVAIYVFIIVVVMLTVLLSYGRSLHEINATSAGSSSGLNNGLLCRHYLSLIQQQYLSECRRHHEDLDSCFRRIDDVIKEWNDQLEQVPPLTDGLDWKVETLLPSFSIVVFGDEAYAASTHPYHTTIAASYLFAKQHHYDFYYFAPQLNQTATTLQQYQLQTLRRLVQTTLSKASRSFLFILAPDSFILHGSRPIPTADLGEREFLWTFPGSPSSLVLRVEPDLQLVLNRAIEMEEETTQKVSNRNVVDLIHESSSQLGKSTKRGPDWTCHQWQPIDFFVPLSSCLSSSEQADTLHESHHEDDGRLSQLRDCLHSFMEIAIMFQWMQQWTPHEINSFL